MLVVLVKIYMLRLRKILLSDILYLVLLFITIIYMIIYLYNYDVKSIYNLSDNEFYLTIKSINIDGDKLSLELSNKLIGIYYFDTYEEKQLFNYKIGDKVKIIGELKEANNNTIPNTFNYKKYLYHNGIKYILYIDNISLISKNNNIFYKIKNYIIDRISKINNNEYLYAFILGK